MFLWRELYESNSVYQRLSLADYTLKTGGSISSTTFACLYQTARHQISEYSSLLSLSLEHQVLHQQCLGSEMCDCREYRPVAYPGILLGGVQQIQFRTEDRENRDLGAVAP